MKPAANTDSYSQPLTPPNSSHQMFKYNEPKQEPALNRNLVDPDYIYAIPEGSCGEVKLPAGPKSPSGKKRRKKKENIILIFYSFFFFLFSLFPACVKKLFPLTAPDLPPRPTFLELMPEYVQVLPSTHPSPSSSRSFPSRTPTASSFTSKGTAVRVLFSCFIFNKI